MKIVVSLIPVFLFLIFLIYLDSFKLIKIPIAIICVIWGLISALIAYYVNSSILSSELIEFENYSKYIAPIVEEILKFLLIIILIRINKIGFMIDGAIYGFAVGAGFAFIENIFYLNTIETTNMMIWVVRGFGTAVMHGGATSITVIFAMSLINQNKHRFHFFIPGLFIAMVIHALYNQFFLSPLISTIVIIVAVVGSIMVIFQRNEKSLQDWLEVEFDSEVKLLQMIKKGKFSTTKTGEFLLSIKDRYTPEIVFDMYCYISLYLELSIRAKSNLMLKENGLPVQKDEGLKNKLEELKALQKNIGKTGLMAISPILRMSKKDLWKLSLLE
ncbi:MAG: PrsW family intramembrane metalloprotease [Saprospiraceae bacterium]|nr:PrsW family intramembrane metalloprotease [Saprospiraceae bacterium]